MISPAETTIFCFDEWAISPPETGNFFCSMWAIFHAETGIFVYEQYSPRKQIIFLFNVWTIFHAETGKFFDDEFSPRKKIIFFVEVWAIFTADTGNFFCSMYERFYTRKQVNFFMDDFPSETGNFFVQCESDFPRGNRFFLFNVRAIFRPRKQVILFAPHKGAFATRKQNVFVLKNNRFFLSQQKGKYVN